MHRKLRQHSHRPAKLRHLRPLGMMFRHLLAWRPSAPGSDKSNSAHRACAPPGCAPAAPNSTTANAPRARAPQPGAAVVTPALLIRPSLMASCAQALSRVTTANTATLTRTALPRGQDSAAARSRSDLRASIPGRLRIRLVAGLLALSPRLFELRNRDVRRRMAR